VERLPCFDRTEVFLFAELFLDAVRRDTFAAGFFFEEAFFLELDLEAVERDGRLAVFP
jgi:hypothetical protein